MFLVKPCRVTGRGHIDINRISGYLPGKIVFFLMQVCRNGRV
jgi:6-phosphofructo-2-kinase/fructose-2,6-biphosphatase